MKIVISYRRADNLLLYYYIIFFSLQTVHRQFAAYQETKSLGYFLSLDKNVYTSITNNNDLSVKEGLIDLAICNENQQKLEFTIPIEPCFKRLEECEDKMFSLGIVFQVTRLGTGKQRIVSIGGYRLVVWRNELNQTIGRLSWNLNEKEAFKIEFIFPFEVWAFMEFFVFEDRVVYYLNDDMHTVKDIQESGYQSNYKVQLADEDLDICFDEVTYLFSWRDPTTSSSKHKKYYKFFKNCKLPDSIYLQK